MRLIEDSACLVFLERELNDFASGKDDAQLVEALRQTWNKMTRAAQALAMGLDYAPQPLGCLIEAIAEAESLQATSPLAAPRLPAATVRLLRDSWGQVPKSTFGEEFFVRLYAEDADLRPVFGYAVARPANIWKTIQLLLDLCDSNSVPRQERVAHAIGALGRRFGRLRMRHIAAVKRAFVRTITGHTPAQDQKRVNRAWEAFFYALTAVIAPHLVLEEGTLDLAAAFASAMPTPGGGPQASACAAHGVALLEMSLGIAGAHGQQGDEPPPRAVLQRLSEARGWLVDSVRDDVNAYCGLLATVYGKPGNEGLESEAAERRRWLRRATEVPLRVAEVSLGAAIACVPYSRTVRKSLRSDWISGAEMLQAALLVAIRNAEINVKDLARDGAVPDIDARLRRLHDTEPPWRVLCDVSA